MCKFAVGALITKGDGNGLKKKEVEHESGKKSEERYI
jgi:hypothetical protein